MRLPSGLLGFLLPAAAILAPPAARAQQVAPAPFTSLTGAFDDFATATAALPEAERVQRFRERFARLLPGFYRPRGGLDDARYNQLVAKALADYPALRTRFLAASAAFSRSYADAGTRFRRFFPDYDPRVPVYLLHSLGEMDGGMRTVEGKSMMVFGADVIARLHDAGTMGAFLDHELFHIYHGARFEECGAVWCQLWTEGLATYVASRLNPGASDRALLLTQPRPIRAEVDARLGEAFCFLRARLDSQLGEDHAALFRSGAAATDFPPRFGYYLGYRIAAKLGETHSLAELAGMRAAEVRPAMTSALNSLAACD
jgi:hypothetical protein